MAAIPLEEPAHKRIPLSQLRESPTNPRKTFDEGKLAELTANVAEHGVLEPILVRPWPGEEGVYEIIAGARRFRAATAAGLPAIDAMVRELADDRVIRIQLIENIQRDDLTAYDEAETYARMLEEGMSVREIATIVSKKAPFIYARLALTKLAPKVKEALAAGKLPVSHAEVIGRIPDHDLQEAALAQMFVEQRAGNDFQKRIKVPVSLETARAIVHNNFMTVLSAAPFDTEDADLSPLGACSKCRFRSGSDRDLFGDIKGKNVCTNIADFQLKVENHLLALRASGKTVLISEKEIRTAFPSKFNANHISGDYVDLEQRNYSDAKQRTWGELLSEEAKERTVYAFVDGRMRTLYPRSLLVQAVESSGRAVMKPEKREASEFERKQREKQKEDRLIRLAIGAAFAENVRKAKLAQTAWIDLLVTIVVEDKSFQLDDIMSRHGYEGTKEALGQNRDTIIAGLVEKMTDAQKRAFVIDALICNWIGSYASESKRKVFRDAMELFAVDIKAIEKQVRRELQQKAKDKEKKAAKRAAASEE